MTMQCMCYTYNIHGSVHGVCIGDHIMYMASTCNVRGISCTWSIHAVCMES